MTAEFWFAIPSSLLEDSQNLREKTNKIGIIARAAGIFKVTRIYIFDVRHKRSERKLMQLLLEYLEVPQYLRRMMYPLREELKFAGLLPPLKIPSHVVTDKINKVKSGDIRDGVIVNQGDRSYVELGLGRLVSIDKMSRPGERVTVEITSNPPNLTSRRLGREMVMDYWGYNVHWRSSLRQVLKDSNPNLTLLTSRGGTDISTISDSLRKNLSAAKSVLAVFGSPRRGLFEILDDDGLRPNDIDAEVVNLFPDQGVETIRSEEAVIAGLGILKLLVHMR